MQDANQLMSSYPLKHSSTRSTASYNNSYPLSDRKRSDKEVVIFSLDSFDVIVKHYIKDKIRLTRWENMKSTFESSAGYFATGQDLIFISNLANYLYGNNSAIVVKNYSGAPHIIVTGSPALKVKIKGVAKLLPTPTVAKFAVGPEAALNSIKSGGVITIILLSSYRVIDHFLGDKQTLSTLLGTIASDIIKVGLSSAAAAIFVNFAASVAGVTVTLSAGPILAAIVISSAVGLYLNKEDQDRGLTQKLIRSIDTYIDRINRNVKSEIEEEHDTAIRRAHSMVFSQQMSKGLL
ncbi:hypothetical protein ACB087_22965 [Vibrio sp. VNB-15]